MLYLWQIKCNCTRYYCMYCVWFIGLKEYDKIKCKGQLCSRGVLKFDFVRDVAGNMKVDSPIFSRKSDSLIHLYTNWGQILSKITRLFVYFLKSELILAQIAEKFWKLANSFTQFCMGHSHTTRLILILTFMACPSSTTRVPLSTKLGGCGKFKILIFLNTLAHLKNSFPENQENLPILLLKKFVKMQ